MSANTSIREGGSARSFGPITCLMVEGGNGEFYPWYPEADRQLDSLSVNKNGIYRASDRGVYGWNHVSVNVAQSDRVTGKDPETGEEKTVTADPETGELVETVVPVEIRVIEPPTNPYGTYLDGQTITKDGMVVKAYGANEDEMQVVPIGEITINPTTAVYDQSQDKGITGDATIEDTSGLSQETINALPIGYGTQIIGVIDTVLETGMPGGISNAITSLTHTAAVYTFVQPFGNTKSAFACSSEPFSGVITTHNPGGIQPYNTNFSADSSIINNKRVYHKQVVGSGNWNFSTPPTNLAYNSAEAAYVILYGTRDERPAGSPQTITVSWPRPGDGAILETTFDILVGPRGGQGDD